MKAFIEDHGDDDDYDGPDGQDDQDDDYDGPDNHDDQDNNYDGPDDQDYNRYDLVSDPVPGVPSVLKVNHDKCMGSDG